MQQALVESRKTGRTLTDVLESMTGQQLSPELLRQYKKQQLFELKILYGVESLDPEVESISDTQVTQLIGNLISVDICRRHRLVPLSKTGEVDSQSVLVAMVDPENLEAQDDLNPHFATAKDKAAAHGYHRRRLSAADGEIPR